MRYMSRPTMWYIVPLIAIATAITMMDVFALHGMTGILNGAEKPNSERKFEVLLWQANAKSELPVDEQWVASLVDRSEKIFTSADDSLNLIVTGKGIEQLRGQMSLEIVYPKGRQLKVGWTKTEYRLRSLLIPLIGNNATVYFRVGNDYSSGPLVNSREGTAQLRQVLIQHNVISGSK